MLSQSPSARQTFTSSRGRSSFLSLTKVKIHRRRRRSRRGPFARADEFRITIEATAVTLPRIRRLTLSKSDRTMSEHGKCPMGKYPWLATFLVLAFVLVFLAHKLGLL